VSGLWLRIRQSAAPLPFAWQSGTERRAAVLLPIFVRDGVESILLTVRRGDLKQHAGQIAFPGGMDDGDADPVACALRETHEEVGIKSHCVEPLGHLGTRISSTGYRVHCVIGRVPEPDPGLASRGEVARLLTVPANELLDPQRWHLRTPPPRPDGSPIPASPHYEVGSDVIWGLTGRFLWDLAQALARTANGR
jgi:8-oxo-dGTP pyrophosphatase MutT (NUDIX family)